MSGPRTIAVPRLMHIGPGALHDLVDGLTGEFDLSSVVVVSGQGESRSIAEGVAASLAPSSVLTHTVADGSLATSAALLSELDEHPPTLLIAVGGGRPIDVAKLAATRGGIDLVAVPTVLSHDGMCSPVASLLARDGSRRSVGAAMPAGVVIDTTVVAAAPERFLRAGVGDLLSNLTAILDWRRAAREGRDQVDELAASIAQVAAQSALDIDWPPTEEDLVTIARGLVMSGMAMEIAGSSRPCSGAEHLVSHALDAAAEPTSLLHGEQVALGIVVTAPLHADPMVRRAVALLERMGVPRSPAGWGIDPARLARAIEHAPSTRIDRYTVLDELELSPEVAVELVADAFQGREP